MSSYRHYTGSGVYGSRLSAGSGSGGGSTYGKSTTTTTNSATGGSTYGSYRSNYAPTSGSSVLRAAAAAKEKFGSAYTSSNYAAKKEADKAEDKPTYRYLYNKNVDKEKPSIRKTTTSTTTRPDLRPSSRASSSGTSSPYLDRYGSSSSVQSIRDSDNGLSSKSSSDYGKNYAINRKDSGSTYRSMYSRVPSYAKTENSTQNNESSSTPTIAKSNGTTTSNGRYSAPIRNNPERVTATIGHTNAKRFQVMKPSVIAPSSKLEVQTQKKEEKKPEVAQEITISTEDNEDSKSEDENESVSEEEDDEEEEEGEEESEEEEEEEIVIKMSTRGTSPTPPPALTAFTRTRRLEPIPKVFERRLKRSQLDAPKRDQEQQIDESFREKQHVSRYTSTGRVSGVPWVSSYIDKFSAAASSYTPRTASYSATSSGSSNRPNTTSNISYSAAKSRDSGYSSIKDAPCKDTTLNDAESLRSHNTYSETSSISRDTSARSSPSPIRRRRATTSEEKQQQQQQQQRKSESRSRDSSPRIVEGQDQHHAQINSSRRDSTSSNASSTSHSRASSNATTASRSCAAANAATAAAATTRSRQSSVESVSLPSGRSGGKSSNSSSSSSSSSSNASMTKIKLAANATTSSSPAPSKCVSAAAAAATTTTTVSTRQASPAYARDRKPPVPKVTATTTTTTTTAEMIGKGGSANMGAKYVNKDFRKSALNMENGDPSRSQIMDRKIPKRTQRSMSNSSQDSDSSKSKSSASSPKPVSRLSSPKSLTRSAAKDTATRRGSSSNSSSSSESPRNVASSRATSEECGDTDNSASEFSNSDVEDSNRRRRERKSSSRRSSKSSDVEQHSNAFNNNDKPPLPPSSSSASSSKGDKIDEAKNFLIKALSPVTNLFAGGKKEQQKSTGGEIRNGGWVDASISDDSSSSSGSSNNSSASASRRSSTDEQQKRPRLTSTSSGGEQQQQQQQLPWGLDTFASDSVAENVDRYSSVASSRDDLSQDTTISTVLPDDGKFKIRVWRQDSEERAFWNQEDDEQPEAATAAATNIPATSPVRSTPASTPSQSRRGSTSHSNGGSGSAKQQRLARIKRQQSGELPWWASDDPAAVPEGVRVLTPPLGQRIKRIESGENLWWPSDSTSPAERHPNQQQQQQKADESEESNDEDDEEFVKVDIGLESETYRGIAGLARFPLHGELLGDRSSPEGIETPSNALEDYSARASSPYDNVAAVDRDDIGSVFRRESPKRSPPRKRPPNLPLFIGDSKNIDDLLGDVDEPGSSGDEKNDDEKDEEEEECREIDAAEVIIHDSTPQTPVIQRRNREGISQPEGYIPQWQFMPEAQFAPVVERSNHHLSFITRSPEELMRDKEIANDVPIVFTTVSEEGCDPGAAYASHDNLLKELNDYWLSLAPHVLQYNYTLPTWQHRFVARLARNRYFGRKAIDAGSTKSLIKLLTDKHYLYDIERAARMHAQAAESPVYLYYYSYQSGQSRSQGLSHTDKNYGVCHCDDLHLVTKGSGIDPAKSKKALLMSNLLMDIWESVAYNRIPSVKGVEWQPINANDRKTAFLHIRSPKEYGMSSSYNMGNKRFWDLFFNQKILDDFEVKKYENNIM